MITRVKHVFTNQLWSDYRDDETIMFFFPDKFKKAVPPKDYFWSVIAILKPDIYRNLIEKAKHRLGDLKKVINNNIILTEEANKVFEEFDGSELKLLSDVISKRR